jgi:hypothetical protein
VLSAYSLPSEYAELPADPSEKYYEVLLAQLLEALSTLPGVTAHGTQALGGAREIDLVVSGTPLKLLVEATKAVFPRDVRELLWQLKRPSSSPPPVMASDDVAGTHGGASRGRGPGARRV